MNLRMSRYFEVSEDLDAIKAFFNNSSHGDWYPHTGYYSESCFCFLQVHPAPDERQHEQAAVQLVSHEPGQEAQVGGLGDQGDPPEEQPGGQGQEKRGAKGKRKQPTIITKLCPTCCCGKRTSSRRPRIKKTQEEQY